MKAPEITEEDKATLKDMREKYEYFLKKYEGYGLQIVTTSYYAENGMKTTVENRLVKLMGVKQ